MPPGVVRQAARRSEMQVMFAVRMRLGRSRSGPASSMLAPCMLAIESEAASGGGRWAGAAAAADAAGGGKGGGGGGAGY